MFKSKKVIALLLAVLMVATLMVGCSSEKPAESKPVESTPVESTPVESTPVEKVPSADDQEPVTLICASGSGSDTYGVKLLQWMCDEITARTEGKVTVECYPDGQLYGTAQLPEAVMAGAIDIMHNGTAGTWPDYCPVFNFTEAWFLWTNREHIKENIQEYKDLLYPLWEEMGVKGLYLGDQGSGGILTKDKKITGPDDLKGLLMVGPNEPDWVALETIGATPVQMASSERYDALAKGAIDGLRLTYTGFTRYSLQDHCKYFVPATSITVFGIVMNLDTWNSLSTWAQDIIMEVALETEAKTFDASVENEAANLGKLTDACETYELTKDDVAKFQAALKPYYDELMAKCVEAGYEKEAQRFLEIAAG